MIERIVQIFLNTRAKAIVVHSDIERTADGIQERVDHLHNLFHLLVGIRRETLTGREYQTRLVFRVDGFLTSAIEFQTCLEALQVQLLLDTVVDVSGRAFHLTLFGDVIGQHQRSQFLQ